MLDSKTKQKIIRTYLQTVEGQKKLAISMLKPLKERIAYLSIPNLVLKLNEWNDYALSWLYSSYTITKDNKLQQVKNAFPKIFKFKISSEFKTSLLHDFDRLVEITSNKLHNNENNVFWDLIKKLLNKKLIKSVIRKAITIKYLKSLSQKYDYAICTTQVYSSFRKALISSPEYDPGKGCLIMDGLGKINKMQFVVSRSVPENTIFFFKRSSGEMVRNIDDISIKTKKYPKIKDVSVIVSFKQQFACAIDPRQIFAVKLWLDDEISVRTLRMIDKSMKNLAKGIAGKPIDLNLKGFKRKGKNGKNLGRRKISNK